MESELNPHLNNNINTNSTGSSSFDSVHSILVYSSILIVVVGVPGNILMFIVFSRNALSKLSVSLYFRVMALANLFININWIKKFAQYQYGFVLIDQSGFLCKTIMFSIYTVSAMAAWFMVAASVDRFLVIAFPTRFMFLQKARFPLYVVIAISGYNIIFNFHILIDTDLVSMTTNSSGYNLTTNECDWPYKSAFYLLILTHSTLVPFLIMIASTIGMTLAVHSSRNRVSSAYSNSSESFRLKRMRDLKFSITMIFINIVFLILNAPNPLFNAMQLLNFGSSSIALMDYINSALFYTFYSIVFYLQVFFNSLVRRQFFELFKCFKR